MDLILWRHADARDGVPDMERALTDKGQKQARSMADWLLPRLPGDARILVSPATRAISTADALGRDYEVVPEIAPGADGVHVLAAAGWPDASGTVLVVGHQPTLGEAACLLLFGEARPLSMKKAGVLWLTNRVRGNQPQTVLKAAMTVEMV
ncbi:MAG TPA: histidine phosphatase family protein [Thiobacillaceae bacterium]|nr:histidine phosphatase family protein [Thiobacillaceae bacterium]HNA83395.1 histidine phosphatase family protein [Thiobacillaceae bacterium]HNF89323.1 histidine phosphatase family protein [Thiobacillaceae bacterium]HNH88092.1 histidine phosphatase family protein [Thiobacillaceae bacterium]HNI07770.1 histidine phosphatase family protein [Thiobacillaceae bacterium]